MCCCVRSMAAWCRLFVFISGCPRLCVLSRAHGAVSAYISAAPQFLLCVHCYVCNAMYVMLFLWAAYVYHSVSVSVCGVYVCACLFVCLCVCVCVCVCVSPAPTAPGPAAVPQPCSARPTHASSRRPPAGPGPRRGPGQPPGPHLRPGSPTAPEGREEAPGQQRRAPERYSQRPLRVGEDTVDENACEVCAVILPQCPDVSFSLLNGSQSSSIPWQKRISSLRYTGSA